MRKPSVLVIFLTVFIDLVGFGIVVPLVPLYGREFGAPRFIIGVIIASFSAMQFIFSPIWGRLSDRYGRRPILLISTAGAAISYVIFGISSGLQNHVAALSLMIFARAFAGMCGGNITVAQAYIADITPPENRSKKMGLIGMAFGLGFIFGPAIGGISSDGISLFGHGFKGFGPTGPGFVAATLCAANFILAYFILTESHTPSSEHIAPRPRFNQWSHTLGQPKIGLLILTFFLATFCFSCFESTLAIVVSDNFNLGVRSEHNPATKTVTSLFVFCGLIGALVQGGMIGRMVKKFGEPKLIGLSLVLTAISLAMFPFIKGSTPLVWGALFHPECRPWLWMLGALAILALGSSLTRPPLFGLMSNLTSPQEQGATIGVAQSAGSLARIIGPIFATTLLVYSAAVPYLICTAILLGASILVFQRLSVKSPALPANVADLAK